MFRTGFIAFALGSILLGPAVVLGQSVTGQGSSGQGSSGQGSSGQGSASGAGQQQGEMRRIGTLGQSVAATKIFRTMSTSGRVVWNLKPFQYLVINDTRYDRWKAVLLSNGETGFILSEKVAELPYDVEVPASFRFGGSRRTGNVASRGSSGGTATGNPQSKSQLLQYSFRYMGTPYRWGGNDLRRGIDCSGFVQQLFGRIGVDLPRTAAQQALVGKRVERLEDLQPGDRLYFWDRRRGKIGHTGIFLGYFQDGGAYFIHSSSNNRGVDTDDLRNPRWLNILVSARR